MTRFSDLVEAGITTLNEDAREIIEYLIQDLLSKGALIDDLIIMDRRWDSKRFLVWSKGEIAYELKTVFEGTTAQFVAERCEVP